MEEFVFISPDYSQIKLVCGVDRDDAVEAFESMMFTPEQPSELQKQQYRDWLIYEKDSDIKHYLDYVGRVGRN